MSTKTSLPGNPHAFAAYPASIPEVVLAMRNLPDVLEQRKSSITVQTWENNDIAGYCLIDPILDQIQNAHFVLADITRLNFNVIYEIGYSLAKGRRLILLRNRALKPHDDLMRELGVFDTIGYKDYQNAEDIAQVLESIESNRALPLPEKKRGNSTPFFIIWPNDRTESEIRLLSRIKKQARVGFRQFDPKEEARLPLNRAVENVVNADGIILPLISLNRRDAEVHNLRCAFVAGLAHGLGKETLLLQSGPEPVPLDFRDAVSFYSDLADIDRYLSEFTPRVYERTLQLAQAEFPQLRTPIAEMYLGQSAAENEHDQLGHYYIQTDEFQRVLRGEVQVVTGRKGSGKTALFYQIRNKIRNDKRNVVLDLNPEGFQLHKLKTLVLQRMETGTQEHTVTAFWEYLLFLELCYKLLEKDKMLHLHNPTLRAKYVELQNLYQADRFIAEGDFAERLLSLISAIEEKFLAAESDAPGDPILTRERITGFLYQHDLRILRARLQTPNLSQSMTAER